MKPRAAIYCRVSSDDQVQGHSLSYQLEDCRAAAEAAGYDVVLEYSDDGISGKTDRREAFQAVISDAKAKRFDALFLWKWERFARNREDSVVYKNLLRKRLGVKVLAAKDPGGTDSPGDMLIEGVLEVVAEWYSADLQHKVSRSKQRRADMGLPNGDLPFGYVSHPESAKGNPLPPVIEEQEAAIVRMAFEHYSTGRSSLADIAREINATGARTRNKRRQEKYGLIGPRPWTKESVKDTLANPFYRGVISYRGELRPGRQEPIISDELWAKAEAMRKNRRTAGASFTPAYRRYQLKGLVRCVHCGEKLWANSAKSGTYYRDPASVRGLDCIGGSVRVEILDGQMDELMSQVVLPESAIHRVSELHAEQNDFAAVDRERTRLTERQRRIARLYADEMMTDAEYARERLQVEASLSALSQPSRDEVSQAVHYLLGLGALWGEMDDGEKWEALQVMLEAVYINLQTARIVGVRPKASFRQVFTLYCCEWRPRWDSGPQDTTLEQWAALPFAV